MKKWLGSILFIIALIGFGQSVFAIDAQNQPKPLIPTFDQLKLETTVKKTEKKIDPLPKNISNKATKEIEKAKIEIKKSLEGSCKYWWQFALISSILLVVFAIFAKTKPRYFPNNWRFIVYLVPFTVGYATWLLHDYYHFHVRKYEISFLCFNYWLVAGFEVLYFVLIYLLIFGFRDSTKEKLVSKDKKKNVKKTTKNKPKPKPKKPSKTFDKQDAV